MGYRLSTGLKLREIRESWTTKIVQLKSKNHKEEKQLKRELQAQLKDVEQNVLNEQNNLIDVEDLIEVEQKRSESDIEEQIKADLEVEEDKAKVVMQDLECVAKRIRCCKRRIQLCTRRIRSKSSTNEETKISNTDLNEEPICFNGSSFA